MSLQELEFHELNLVVEVTSLGSEWCSDVSTILLNSEFRKTVCTEAAGCWFVVGCAPLLIGMTLKGGLTWKGLHSRAGGGGLRVLSRARHSAGSGRARWCSFLQVLLVSSSRYPDQWIVPGGGMEPEEEPGGAAVREVYEEVR